MHRKYLFLIASWITVMGLLLASCAPAIAPTATPRPTSPPPKAETPVAKTPGSPAPAAPTPKPATEQPRAGGVLTRSLRGEPAHLDLHQATSVDTQLPLANVYSGLVRFDPTDINKVAPDLAEKWDVSPDGKVFTFYLRKGVVWHDGKPFTSEDAKFSLERMAFWKDHKIVSPRGGTLLSAVQKVEAPDPTTVRMTLKYASASLLGNASAGFVVMHPKHVIQARGDMKRDAIGTGPFKWKAWNPGIGEELVKNPDYFVKGLPYLDGITFYVIKDESTRFAALRTGQVKMTSLGSQALSHPQAEMLRKEMADRIDVITHPAAMRHQFFMNLQKKPWDDLRVRQAVTLAFDRKAAITVNFNVGAMGSSMHPNGAWGITEEEIAKRPGYRQPKDADIAEAKRLLAEAGFPQGFKTRMLVRSGGVAEQQGVVARDQLAKVGVDAALDIQDSIASHDLLDLHKFDFALFVPSDPVDDPDTGLSYHVTGGAINWSLFSDKQVDDLFEKQAATLDQKERKKLVVQIQERVLDLAIDPIVFWDVYNMGYRKEVRGYVPGFGPYTHNNLDHVWLAR